MSKINKYPWYTRKCNPTALNTEKNVTKSVSRNERVTLTETSETKVTEHSCAHNQSHRATDCVGISFVDGKKHFDIGERYAHASKSSLSSPSVTRTLEDFRFAVLGIFRFSYLSFWARWTLPPTTALTPYWMVRQCRTRGDNRTNLNWLRCDLKLPTAWEIWDYKVGGGRGNLKVRRSGSFWLQ